MVLVFVTAFAKNSFAVVALVVLVGVFAFGKNSFAVVALVVLVGVSAFAENGFAVVTNVVLVSVYAFAENGFAVVTNVVLVSVFAFGKNCVAVVTNVILVSVFAFGKNFAADVADVVCIFVKASNVADVAAEVTICIASIVEFVSAVDAKSSSDLSVDISIACFAYVGDGRISKVSHEEVNSSKISSSRVSRVNGFSIKDVYVDCIAVEKSVCKGMSGSYLSKFAVECAEINVTENNTVERIVVTKENNSSGGVELSDGGNGGCVGLGELSVAVSVGFACEYESVKNRNVNGVFSVFTKHSVDLFLFKALDVVSSIAESINVSVEEVKNGDGNGSNSGNAGRNEFVSHSFASFVNVLHVVFANESSPIHFGNGSVAKVSTGNVVNSYVEHCKNHADHFVNHVCRGSRNHLSKEFGKRLNNVSVERRLEGFGHISVEEALSLFNSKAAEHVFVEADGDKVSLNNGIGSDSIPVDRMESIVREVESVCKQTGKTVDIRADCEVVGIFGDEVIAVESIINEVLDCSIELFSKFSYVRSKEYAKLGSSVGNQSLKSFSNLGSSLDAKSLEVFYHCVKAFFKKDLDSSLDLVNKTGSVDGFDDQISKVGNRILKDLVEFVKINSVFDRVNDAANGVFDLDDGVDQLFNGSVEFDDHSVKLSKLFFKSSDSSLNLLDRSVELVDQSLVSISNCLVELSFELSKFAVKNAELIFDLTLYRFFEVNELIPSLGLDFVDGGKDFVNDAGSNELIPSIRSKFLAKVANQSEEVAKKTEQTFGSEDRGVNTKSGEVNVEDRPDSVAVGFIPAYECREKNVSVFKDVDRNVVAKGVDDVSKNRDNNVSVFNEESDHVVAVFIEEADDYVRVVVEPVVEVSVNLRNLSKEEVNECLVCFREIFLEVVVCVGDDVGNDSDGVVNSISNGVLKINDRILNGSDLLVDLCSQSVDLFFCVSLNSFNRIVKFSLNSFNCIVKFSLNSFNFSADSFLSLANSFHELFVEDSKLLFSLSIEDSNLLFSLSVQDFDLLFSLSVHFSNVGVSVVTKVNNSNRNKVGNVVNVGKDIAKQSKEICVAFSIKFVCVVNESLSRTNSLASLFKSSLHFVCECFASEVCFCLHYFCFRIVDRLGSKVEIAVDIVDHARLNSFVVCDSVCFVIVFFGKLKKDLEVFNGFLLSSVILVVSGDNSFSKSSVTYFGGVSTKTVTDYAASKECKKTLEFTVSNCITESFGHYEESAKRCNRSGNSIHCICAVFKLGNNTLHGINFRNYFRTLVFDKVNSANQCLDCVNSINNISVKGVTVKILNSSRIQRIAGPLSNEFENSSVATNIKSCNVICSQKTTGLTSSNFINSIIAVNGTKGLNVICSQKTTRETCNKRINGSHLCFFVDKCLNLFCSQSYVHFKKSLRHTTCNSCKNTEFNFIEGFFSCTSQSLNLICGQQI